MDFIFNVLDWMNFFEFFLMNFNRLMDCFDPSIMIQIHIHSIHPFFHPYLILVDAVHL